VADSARVVGEGRRKKGQCDVVIDVIVAYTKMAARSDQFRAPS